MAGGEHHLRGDDGAGAAERRLAGDVHDDEDDGGMGIPIERAVGNEGWATRVSEVAGNSVAAQQADAGGGQDRDDETCSHCSSQGSGTGARIVTRNERVGQIALRHVVALRRRHEPGAVTFWRTPKRGAEDVSAAFSTVEGTLGALK